MDPAWTGNCPGAVAARLGKGCQVRIRAVVPGGKALRRNVGSQTAVQHRRFALGAVAVDVREPDEYAVGHIPGAKLLPLGEVNSRAAEVLPEKEATWLVYCRTGRRSAEAVQKLDALGYSNLYDLGGILSWPYEIEGDFEGHF